jgi:hypothetical protein
MRRLRLLLAVLLLVAIPFKGMAAASMLFCGLQHGEARVAAQAPHHDHASPGDHKHGAVVGDVKCSVCAVCCQGAVAGATPQVADCAAPPQALASPHVVAILARATPPPDKPPRA